MAILPPALFARHPLSRQTLVVLHDVAAVTVALPLAIMLRENQLLIGDRLGYILACLPLLAAASLAACLPLGSYRAVWRYMGIGEITYPPKIALGSAA